MSLLLLQNIEGDNAASEVTNCLSLSSGKTNFKQHKLFSKATEFYEMQ